VLGALQDPRLRELVATLLGRALRAVGQPVPAAVEPDDALEREGDADLLVRLQLGNVEDEGGRERRPAEAVLLEVGQAATRPWSRCLSCTGSSAAPAAT